MSKYNQNLKTLECKSQTDIALKNQRFKLKERKIEKKREIERVRKIDKR